MRKFFLAGLIALAPAAALAHPGEHEGMSFAEDLHHLATEPDHLLALAGLIVLGVITARGVRLLRRARK